MVLLSRGALYRLRGGLQHVHAALQLGPRSRGPDPLSLQLEVFYQLLKAETSERRVTADAHVGGGAGGARTLTAGEAELVSFLQ